MSKQDRERPQCMDCWHWKQEQGLEGDCRAHPPNDEGQYPPTDADEWCGEWKMHPPTDEERHKAAMAGIKVVDEDGNVHVHPVDDGPADPVAALDWLRRRFPGMVLR